MLLVITNLLQEYFLSTLESKANLLNVRTKHVHSAQTVNRHSSNKRPGRLLEDSDKGRRRG